MSEAKVVLRGHPAYFAIMHNAVSSANAGGIESLPYTIELLRGLDALLDPDPTGTQPVYVYPSATARQAAAAVAGGAVNDPTLKAELAISKRAHLRLKAAMDEFAGRCTGATAVPFMAAKELVDTAEARG